MNKQVIILVCFVSCLASIATTTVSSVFQGITLKSSTYGYDMLVMTNSSVAANYDSYSVSINNGDDSLLVSRLTTNGTRISVVGAGVDRIDFYDGANFYNNSKVLSITNGTIYFANTNSDPANTNNPVRYVEVKVGDTFYRLPLYL